MFVEILFFVKILILDIKLITIGLVPCSIFAYMKAFGIPLVGWPFFGGPCQLSPIARSLRLSLCALQPIMPLYQLAPLRHSQHTPVVLY